MSVVGPGAVADLIDEGLRRSDCRCAGRRSAGELQVQLAEAQYVVQHQYLTVAVGPAPMPMVGMEASG